MTQSPIWTVTFVSHSRTSPPDITDDDDNETLLANIRERAYSSYNAEPSAIYGDSTTEAETQGDYHDRFIYELLQNADDAIEGRDDAAVRFEFDGSTLYVANSGRPLTATDVHSLCIQGLSSKSDDEAAIGRKGRGFTSVLELTDRPHVYSTEYEFVFDSADAKEALQEHTGVDDDLSETDVPTLRIPFEPETKPERVGELLAPDSPFTTVFAFDLFEDVQPTIGEKLATIDPQTLVFLQHLERLELAVDKGETIWTLDRTTPSALAGMDAKQVVLSVFDSPSVATPRTKHAFVQFARTGIEITQRDGISDGSWEGIETTQVGVAFKVETDAAGEPIRLQPVSDDPAMHVFLPTEQASPGQFLINGAFKPESSRTGLTLFDREEGYNALLFDHVAKLITSDVLAFAEETHTSVTDLLACLSIDESRLHDDCEEYAAKRLREEIADVPFIPTPDTGDTFERGPGRASISELRVPSTALLPEGLIRKFVGIAGPDPLPEALSESRSVVPSEAISSNPAIEALLSLGAAELNPASIPAVLAAVNSDRAEVRPYESVGKRAAVDPIVDVLLGVDAAVGGDLQETFREQLPEYPLFPTDVTDSGQIERTATADTSLLLPPEDIVLTKQFPGLKLFAPEIYRPEGWEAPAGQGAESDGFKEALQSMWNVDEFDFSSFVQGAVFPYLPRGRDDESRETELQDRETLSVLRELAMSGSNSVVDAASPLPHEFRKKVDYYRLCLLKLPTKSGEWVRAYRVYMGPEWVDNEEVASAVPLLRDYEVDAEAAPELVSPSWFLESVAAPTVESDDAGEAEAEAEGIARWRLFLRWLGAAPELKLTPLWHPEKRREYSSTRGISRPSSEHPTLGEGGPSEAVWDRFAEELTTAVDDIEGEESVNTSIYRANRLDFWAEIRPRVESSPQLGRRLFTHLAYWWDEVYGPATNVGVGRHSTSASNVGSRSGGVPYRHERLSLGTNMWLCELQAAAWCPADSGQYPPERVWQRRSEVVDRFSLGEDSETVVLPLLPDSLWETTAELSADFFEALGIHGSVSQETFEPEDAIVGMNRIARWCEDNEEALQGAARQLRTGYRNIARAVPDVGAAGSRWRDLQDELGGVEVLCSVDDELVLRAAREAFFVLDRPEADSIPIAAPTFILMEPDASRLGSVCGMTRLNEAVTKEVTEGAAVDAAGAVRRFLRGRENAIRCVLAGDRPGQRESDAEAVGRFIRELAVVDSLAVEYSLPGYSTVTEDVGWAVERHESAGQRRTPYVTPPVEGEPPIQRIAKALADYVPYPGVSDLILIMQAPTEALEERLRLLDAPVDLLDGDAAMDDAVVSFDDEGTSTAPIAATEGLTRDRTTAMKVPSTGESEAEQRSTASTNPKAELIDPEAVRFEFDSQFDLEPRTGSRGGGSGSAGAAGSSESGSSSNPQAAGKRSATDAVGSDILRRFELDRLSRENPSYGDAVIRECVVSVETPEDIEDAREQHDAVDAVLTWLVETVGLDGSYPGFDYLVVEPSFVDEWDGAAVGNAAPINRLIELKSKRGDGQVSLSMNEWLTATTDAVAETYYLYVIGNLAADGGDEFVRRVADPASVLERRRTEQDQTNVSVTVNTKRFSSHGDVTQTPLRSED